MEVLHRRRDAFVPELFFHVVWGQRGSPNTLRPRDGCCTTKGLPSGSRESGRSRLDDSIKEAVVLSEREVKK